MAATTLKQYWIDEVTRLIKRRDAQRDDVASQRQALTSVRALQLAASTAVLDESAAVATARKNLASIPMPADGDPLLTAMEQALVGLAEAQADLAANELAAQTFNGELMRKESLLAGTAAALGEAERKRDAARKDADARQNWIETLTTGALATLAADATTALASYAATARARVEGEFPGNDDDAMHFLKRARARRSSVAESHQSALAVQGAAFVADTSALAQAQRAFDSAASAVRVTADAAPQLETDRMVLQQLSGLPAPNANPPATYPIVTRWQHDRLHDAASKDARESALAKFTAVDDTVAAARTARQAYDLALHAAMQADPDKTQGERDAGPVAAERDALDSALTDVTTARNQLSAGELATLRAWFAAVPDTLWNALDKLDTAVTRLQALAGPPTPANLITAMTSAEATLAAALEAERLAQRKAAAAGDALLRATALLVAERETMNQRSLAYEHSAALLPVEMQ